MLKNPSLVTRVAIGKLVGLIFGIMGFAFCEFFLPETDWMLRWGITSSGELGFPSKVLSMISR